MINPTGETPPDSTGAIGLDHYVEMINSEVGVFNRSDLSNVSVASLPTFIGDPFDDPFCDVQVQWDPTAGRWLFLFLYCPTSGSAEAVVFGWSKTADPSDLVNGWCSFAWQTTPYLLDYPKLGHNSRYLIIGANSYDMTTPSGNPPFVTARLGWMPKPASGVTTCPTSVPITSTSAIGPIRNGDGTTKAFTPVPVNTMSGSTDGYIVSAYDAGNNVQPLAPQTKLAIWHLDDSGRLFSHGDITVTSFAMPSPAPQLGGSFPIDTLDARLTQAAGDPTSGIWTQHTVNGPGGRSVVRWYEIKVAGSTASLTQQGDIASATDWVFNGAVSPRFDAVGAAVFYNRSSASTHLVIAGKLRFSSTPAGAMEPGELVLATSTNTDTDFSCNYLGSGFPCRWGDYSGASPDPVQTGVVWGTNQFIPPPFNSDPTYPAWNTENFAIVFVAPPTSITAVAGDQNAYVRWTPTSNPSSTNYTVTAYVGASSVGSIEVLGPASSVNYRGLTNGVTYTFTVIAHALGDSSPETAHSNAVTPTRAGLQSSPNPIPTRDPATQSSPKPLPTGR